MGRGHGVILNMSSYLPFIFVFNPTEVDIGKKINYVTAPNIGGSHKKKYFTGFDSKEAKVNIVVLDMQSVVGVQPYIDYFEQLREPDPGLFGISGSFAGFGND